MATTAAEAALSSLDDDGDVVQPCKKRKEEDSSIKAITKYFTPLGKNFEKVLSPPKSNSIMDYLKKSCPTNEKIISSVTPKAAKMNKSLEISSRTLLKLKRRGKRCNLNSKLNEINTFQHDLVTEINSCNNQESTPKEKACKPSISHRECEMLDSAVPAMPDLTTAKEILNDCSTSNCSAEEGKMKVEGNIINNNMKQSKKGKYKFETGWSEDFSTEIQQKSQCKKVEEKQIACKSENDSTVNTLDPETATCETMQLNDNTIIVSFEDFLKSQSENKVDQIPGLQTPDSSIATDETINCQTNQQLPFKKVTVLAQIHSIPPKSTCSRKIASIFLKQKNREPKRQSSLIALEEKYMEQISQKRKSNVVISEEELELAVLETAGIQTVKSKCTAEEKYLFLKAFRQPESNIKNGGKKGSSKQKDLEEKTTKHKVEVKEYEEVSNKNLGNSVSSNFTGANTRIRNNKLRRKKAIMETKKKDVIASKDQHDDTNSQFQGAVLSETQNKLSQEKNELRESPQQRENKVSIDITPEKARISAFVSEKGPLQASTPKANKSFTKNNLYKAEVITELFDSKSPIRMKFTRISRNERSVQRSIKTNSISNNIFKAKKLVEKAKVLQQNRATRSTEDTSHAPLRRSFRQLALAEKKRLQNLQDSVIILDSSADSVTAVSKSSDKQKQLPSLNDVLGKGGTLRVTKAPNGKEKMSSLIKKKVQKCTNEAVTVFDESSEHDSENSHDDEQFRAKRAFLMSGLPESLKRQMARKTAALEAHSAISCFQKVIHVQQKDYDCSMWRLTPPLCSLLTKLREVNSKITDVAKLTFSVGEFSLLNAQHNISTASTVIRSSGQRPAFSETQRNCLLEEIQSYNTPFAIKQFFDLLSTKHAGSENNKQVNKYSCISSETNRNADTKEIKRRRKAKDHKSKRRKQVEKMETALLDKTSEVSFVKQSGVENTISVVDRHQREKSGIITTEDSPFRSEVNSVSDSGNEDMLWTEKYQPQNSNELIGNTVAVKKLYRWLCEWRRRADLEENRAREEKESASSHESSDSMDFKDYGSDSEEESVLCNTVLLTGPPGIGKTAAVYACAQELGFKIFEVNASCQRSGRQILSQLKEATQSHQVDQQGTNAYKPCFLNNYCSTKSPKETSPRKECSPRKTPVSPRRAGLKQGLPSKTIANYFKVSSKTTNKEEKVQRNNKGNKESIPRKKVQNESLKKESEEEDSSKKMATSLILFEEVDIIFDEDVGFLNAIKTFMSTTKRPIILTTNDPSFSFIFDGCLEEIIFSPPSLIDVASYLQVVCLAENLRTDVRDFTTLLTANNCDIRQSILQLQFWVKSGGGYLKQKGQEKEVNDTEQIPCTEEITNPNTSKLNLPTCEVGFIDSLFGLRNILLSEDLFSFLKHEVATKEEWSKLTHLLTEFQMKNVDFIYSNLPFILPLPVNMVTEIPAHTTLAQSCLSNKTSDNDCREDANPVKNKQKKRRRNIALLDDSDLFENELDYSGLITLPSEPLGSHVEEKAGRLEPVRSNRKALTIETAAKPKSSACVSQCLNSLTEFVNNMSVLDYCFNRKIQQPKQSSKYEEFIWAKGKIKNGLSDEFSLDSLEHTDWWNTQSSSELKATVEALSFSKCFKNISEMMENNSERTLGKEECEGITLHISKEQANWYFHQSLADSRIQHNAQKRLEIINSVFSKAPLNFCNRQASIVEYLPVLRFICKSEKQKEKRRTKRRFLHYLEGIHLSFPREIMNRLGTGFP